MKNILGTNENLELFDKNGNLIYEYHTNSLKFTWERKWNSKGFHLYYKDSEKYSWKSTRDENGDELTYQDSDGYKYKSKKLK